MLTGESNGLDLVELKLYLDLDRFC